MTQAFNLSQLANNLNASGRLDATDGLVGAVPVANGGTGQTTLTANSVVLGNGTSAVQLVAPSTSGNVLTSNGTSWVSSASPNVPPNSETFTSSGTFNVPSGVTRVKVTVIAAGGNGGTGYTDGVCSNFTGGGGGGGGYVVSYVGVTSGGTATVTVGVNTATRTSSFAGTTTITAAGGTNGVNASTSANGNSGLSGASTIFGITNYSTGLNRTSDNVYANGFSEIITSGTNSESSGQVYGHGFGVAGELRSATAGATNRHTPLGYGAGAGGGAGSSGITGAGVGRNGLVIVEW